jgi:hypothetical protein
MSTIASKGLKVYGNLLLLPSSDPITFGYGLINNIDISILNSDVTKLKPPPSSDLSTLTLSMNFYSARKATDATVLSNVQNTLSNRPQTLNVGPFTDGDKGQLKGYFNEVLKTTINLTTGDDTQDTGYIQIISDSDPYIGQSQKQGFYKSLIAKVKIPTSDPSLTASNTVQYSFRLEHSISGSTPIFYFYEDDTTTPSIVLPAISSVNKPTNKYISGLPCLSTGDNIVLSAIISGAVSQFYHSSYVAYANTVSSSTNVPTYNPVSAPGNYNDINASLTLVPLALKYDENLVINIFGRASDETLSTAGVPTHPTSKKIRIDTLSQDVDSSTFISETSGIRRKSQTGTFPTYTDTVYDSTESLLSNQELQLIGGFYQFPLQVNYSTYDPVGPDYTSISTGSYRWVTFKLASVTNVNNVKIQLMSGYTGFTTVIDANLQFYVKILGSSGWLNANSYYSGVGDPSNDGDAALVYNNSTIDTKYVTFGATTRTGNVVVRIGFNNFGKKIKGVTLLP